MARLKCQSHYYVMHAHTHSHSLTHLQVPGLQDAHKYASNSCAYFSLQPCLFVCVCVCCTVYRIRKFATACLCVFILEGRHVCYTENILVFGSMSMTDGTSNAQFLDDVWLFDTGSQGWETIVFNNESTMGCSSELSINAVMPHPRAGHAMASLGPSALMCGGYNSTGSGATNLMQHANSVDCFWFTPVPEPRWDRLKVEAGSPGPEPRMYASMVFDGDEGLLDGEMLYSVILFGGLGKNSKRLGDCWFLNVTAQLENTVYTETFRWQSCDVSGGAPSPNPRFGHGAVAFRHSLYVIGGFASDGSEVAAQDDMWRLLDYQSDEDRQWEQVMPTSSRPGARGFHAVWLAGFKLILHGGQGAGGAGVTSVLGDTWSFDLFTLVWSRLGSSDALPVASHLSAASWTDSKAVAFGGLSSSSTSSAKLFVFDTAKGWAKGDIQLLSVAACCVYVLGIPLAQACKLPPPHKHMHPRTRSNPALDIMFFIICLHTTACTLTCDRSMPHPVKYLTSIDHL